MEWTSLSYRGGYVFNEGRVEEKKLPSSGRELAETMYVN